MTYRTKRVSARVAATSIGTFAAAAILIPIGATAAESGGVGSGGVGPAAGAPGPAPAPGDGAFPVRGKVTYGDGLGAGRGHQGQDLLAACGKPVVAAQPGRVQIKDYDGSGAGNYVVIDGKGELEDTVYMHMESAAVRKGQRVSAGQVIGRVGTTGRSSACHLHFEIWGGSGWYDGGQALDPRPYLRSWDR